MRFLGLGFSKITYLTLFMSLVLTVFAAPAYAEVTYKVKQTDNLSKIVKKYFSDSKLNQYQIFIGLLAENPDAFRLGNINYLKSGSILNIPDSANLLAMEPTDAANLMAEHNDKAKRGSKVRIDAPFQGHTSKSVGVNAGNTENADLVEKKQINEIANKQQQTSKALQKLDSESEALRIRMEQLMADKEAMDAELLQLNSLLKKQ